MDIDNFFNQNYFYGQKPNWGKWFFGLKFVPDFETQIRQQHLFIIWQDRQTPNQLFFTKIYPNGPTRKQLILRSQIKKTKKKLPSYTMQKWQYCPANLHHVF